MSGTSHGRVRRNASPTTKQGPIKATKAFPIVNCSPTRTLGAAAGISVRSSPILSPISWTSENYRFKCYRISPDNRYSSETNASSFKVEKPRALRPSSGSNLKRSGSLETIVVDRYLTGQWPREPPVSYTNLSSQAALGVFMCDRSTQTSDGDIRLEKHCDHKRSSSLGSGDHLNKEFIKQRLQRTKESKVSEYHCKVRQSPVPGSHTALSTPPFSTPPFKAIVIPATTCTTQPRHPRSSVEGLNTEIEKLVLRTIFDEDRNCEGIPDGHQAPLPDALRNVSSTCSVDTQTPSSVPLLIEDSNPQVEFRSHSVSPAIPIMPGRMDMSRPPSLTDAIDDSTAFATDESAELDPLPKYTTSPKPNNSYSFVREPPDGCEKIKVIDETRQPPIKEPLLVAPIKANTFILKPSDGSAFLPLSKLCIAQDSHLKSSASPIFMPSQGIEIQ